jgi:hypothetical protein
MTFAGLIYENILAILLFFILVGTVLEWVRYWLLADHPVNFSPKIRWKLFSDRISTELYNELRESLSKEGGFSKTGKVQFDTSHNCLILKPKIELNTSLSSSLAISIGVAEFKKDPVQNDYQVTIYQKILVFPVLFLSVLFYWIMENKISVADFYHRQFLKSLVVFTVLLCYLIVQRNRIKKNYYTIKNHYMFD